MDPITQILLTVGLNALVTGIFIYAFQKRMDARYAKKAFEDQIKFQRSHEKRVTTLETLFQTYTQFVAALTSLQFEANATYNIKQPLSNKTLKEKSKVVSDKIHEARRYLDSNGLHLPDKVQSTLIDILTESVALEVMTFELIFRTDWDKGVEPVKMKQFEKAVTFTDSKYLSVPIKDVSSLLTAASMKSFYYMKIIETIYKSIANTDEK